MKKIIIITGISGTGKSSLAKKLYKEIENSTLLSMDTLAENIYDIIGFGNRAEKKSLKFLCTKIYKNLIQEALKREDEIVIVEYPFKKHWIKFFENVINKYGYEAYTIHLFAQNFETIWKRLKERESSPKRHPSHYLESYDHRKKEEYKPYFEYDYNTLKKEYEELESNCINLGKVIRLEDIETLDIYSLIKTINN